MRVDNRCFSLLIRGPFSTGCHSLFTVCEASVFGPLGMVLEVLTGSALNHSLSRSVEKRAQLCDKL